MEGKKLQEVGEKRENSQAIQELEEEIGTEIFRRTNRGIQLMPEGEEFIRYARMVTGQYDLLESRYIRKEKSKKRFSVSMQHCNLRRQFRILLFMNIIPTIRFQSIQSCVSMITSRWMDILQFRICRELEMS